MPVRILLLPRWRPEVIRCRVGGCWGAAVWLFSSAGRRLWHTSALTGTTLGPAAVVAAAVAVAMVLLLWDVGALPGDCSRLVWEEDRHSL